MQKSKKICGMFLLLSAMTVGALAASIGNNHFSQSVLAASLVQGDPKGTFQVDQVFPIYEKDDNPEFDSWSLLNNQLRKFYGFAGQGSLYLKSNDVSKYSLFVNGKPVSLVGIANNTWVNLSIGQLTQNGNNSLQVTVDKKTVAADKLQIKVPYPVLVNKASQPQNIKNDSFKLMDKLVQQEIKHGFPSAQIVVVHNGQIVKQSAYGLENSYTHSGKRLITGNKVTNDTLYDLASNTKMWATNMALQKLVSEKKLDINEKVSSIFPEFKDQPGDAIKGKSDLTIRTILEHTAGFPADPQYHNNNYNPENSTNPSTNSNPVYTQERSEILSKIINTPLQYAPGSNTIYSDVDYMLLGLIVEKVTGQREDTYVENDIYKPLGLYHTVFNPLQKGFQKNQIAATELDGNTRGGTINFNNIRHNTIQGEVHDEKAFYTMKGVSGHAGLFSNASDLAVLAQTVINRGGYGNNQVFTEDTLDEFIKPKSSNPSYGLGWRRNANGWYSWAFSNLSDASTVGHTGWTGTLTVVNPHDNTAIVMLTNERNTPILNAKETPNDFAGGHYLISKYGDIVGLAMSGIENDSVESNNNKLIGLVTARYNEIQINKAEQTAPDKEDLHAIYNTLKERRIFGNSIDQFMKSDIGQEITAFLGESVVKVNPVAGGVVHLSDASGKKQQRTVRQGTIWKVMRKKMIDGKIYYQIGNDREYISEKYVSLV